MPRKGTTNARGYGKAHRDLRERIGQRQVDRGNARCVLCGERILPGSDWHLDHTPDRAGYRGPAHASCNSADGGRRRGQSTAAAPERAPLPDEPLEAHRW